MFEFLDIENAFKAGWKAAAETYYGQYDPDDGGQNEAFEEWLRERVRESVVKVEET